jgi:hypothetical protein
MEATTALKEGGFVLFGSQEVNAGFSLKGSSSVIVNLFRSTWLERHFNTNFE